MERRNWWCIKHKINWDDADWICCPFCNGQLGEADLKRWQFYQNQYKEGEKTMSKTFKYELGDNLIDTITGFTGKVICKLQWYNGCTQYCLKPKMVIKEDEPHKMPNGEYVDEDQLEYVKKPIKKSGEDKGKLGIGGPQSDYPSVSCKS